MSEQKRDLTVTTGQGQMKHIVTDRASNQPVAAFTTSDDAYAFLHKATETQEQAVDRAISIIRRDYHEDVRGCAESIQSELNDRIKDHEYGESLREWLTEHIDETIDGTQRVIYTLQAQLGVICSDNDGAYFEEFGEEGAVEDGSINWSRLCYAAMRADVMRELERMDVDLNSPIPKCGECDSEEQEEERYEVNDQWLCPACNAKVAAVAKARTISREKCVELLEAISIECRGEETVEVLREAVISNIEDGTIDPSELEGDLR